MFTALLVYVFTTFGYANPMTMADMQTAVALAPPEFSVGQTIIQETIVKLGNASEKLGIDLMPSALALGMIVRCQYGIGVCLGKQVNYGKKGNVWEVSTYDFYGGEVGFAEYTTAEAYVAFCYGKCNDAEAQGWFVSGDEGAAIGGGANLFLEMGADYEDLEKSHSLQDVVKAGIFYVGIGFLAGEGGGVSLGVMRYKLTGTNYFRGL